MAVVIRKNSVKIVPYPFIQDTLCGTKVMFGSVIPTLWSARLTTSPASVRNTPLLSAIALNVFCITESTARFFVQCFYRAITYSL